MDKDKKKNSKVVKGVDPDALSYIRGMQKLINEGKLPKPMSQEKPKKK